MFTVAVPVTTKQWRWPDRLSMQVNTVTMGNYMQPPEE